LENLIKSAESTQNYICGLAALNGCPLNCSEPGDLINLGTVADSLNQEVQRLKQLFGLTPIPVNQVDQEDSMIAVFRTQALALSNFLIFPPLPPVPPLTSLPPN